MQIKQILLLAALCLYSISTIAQNLSTIRGTIRNESGVPAASLTIKLQNTPFITTSSQSGAFIIRDVLPGRYTLLVTGVGYKPVQRTVNVTAGADSFVNLKVESRAVDMSTVIVTGRSVLQEVNRQAFNVTAIDAKQLYNSTLDLSGALDRVSGVRVRESGGVGSNFNFSLNGFSGNRVRFFIDGVPMDNFGSSFQINNIPVNIAERIEVYKGVVPVWLGSDALGGAVNIVTGDRSRNYIDASYSYGSFNTHRSVVNTAITAENGLTFQLNAFQNYSDNNYKVTVNAFTAAGSYEPKAKLRRFHDTYHNETLIANAGLMGKKYADKLLLGITLGQNYKEIQTGARPDAVFGGWHKRGNIIMPSLKYQKTNLVEGLDLSLNANYNLGTERNIDTLSKQFDWYGNSKDAVSEGRGKTNSKYRNNNGLVTTTATYRVSGNQTLAFNNIFSTFNRKGTDPFNTGFTRGSDKPNLQKNVMSLGYTYDVQDKWSASVFGKYLRQGGATLSTTNKVGFGLAATYFTSPGFQLKASFERANRLPESNELFGDVELLEGNPLLKPEQSDNINAGFSYRFAIQDEHRFVLNATAIYRYSYNYIYTRYNKNQTALLLDNLDGVFTAGGEGELRYTYRNWLSAGTSVTYQYIQNKQDSVFNEYGAKVKSPVYLDQMPNIPYLFSNTDASVSIKNLGGKGNNLNIGYNLLYVHSFWLYWPSRGGRSESDDKRVVPQQLSHDINVVYSLKNGRYNIGIEGRNLTNALLYDNFSLQKPTRGFYFNLRYFFNKLNN